MNTKRIFSIIAVTIITITATAQRISVVTEDGTTSIFRTLQQAIEEADPGSTIYLPGGGFSIADSVKIIKRLTIIGIGHKPDNENADGSTIISGNLFFNEGSSGSAVMSCYITGNVNIGEGNATVNDVTIRFCNLNSVQVLNNTCQETVVNQSYLRGTSKFSETNAQVSNNIIHSMGNINGGNIINNIFTNQYLYYNISNYGPWKYACLTVNNSVIINNIFFPSTSTGNTERHLYTGSGNTSNNNMTRVDDVGNYSIKLGDIDWNDVFENYNGGAISPVSKFHFEGDYSKYEHEVGIYAGDGFSEDQLAPIPYIISKDIPQQTDAAGNLNIKIRVKAN